MNRSQIFTLAHQNARKLRAHFTSYRAAFAEALRSAYWLAHDGYFAPVRYEDVLADLSIAARRAQVYGASAKQIAYLASLAVKAGERASGLITSGMLTKRQASFYIDQLLAA